MKPERCYKKIHYYFIIIEHRVHKLNVFAQKIQQAKFRLIHQYVLGEEKSESKWD